MPGNLAPGHPCRVCVCVSCEGLTHKEYPESSMAVCQYVEIRSGKNAGSATGQKKDTMSEKDAKYGFLSRKRWPYGNYPLHKDRGFRKPVLTGCILPTWRVWGRFAAHFVAGA